MLIGSWRPAPLSEVVRQGMTPTNAGARLGQWLKDQRDGLFEVERDGARLARIFSWLTDQMVLRLAAVYGEHHSLVLATGGYGRSRLAPFSDVDLLFIMPAAAPGAISEAIMYALWDGGVDLSQSVHTHDSVIDAARADPVFLTSLLTARPLVGDPVRLDALFWERDCLLKDVGHEFIRKKIEERESRLARLASERYAVEHDVKEAEGGLRDADVVHWLRLALRICIPGTAGHILRSRERRRLALCADTLWGVRVHLHQELGRHDDTMGFEVQPRLAQRLGYRGDAAAATDRFLRRYFLTTKEIARVTRRAVARTLDIIRDPVGLSPVPYRMALGPEGTATVDDFLDLFERSGRDQVPVHPDALADAAQMTRRLDFRTLHEPEIGARIRRILDNCARLEPVLRTMAECGFLGRLLPSFGAIVGKAEYGLFRRFTLDEHALQSIGALDAYLAGEDEEIAAIVPPSDVRHCRTALAMALLLHEAGGSSRTPLTPEARTALSDRIMRLMADNQLAEDIVFLVDHRLAILRALARRRVFDLSLVNTLADFIRTPKRLSMLFAFSSCRARIAGVGSWEQYARRDVSLLYELLNVWLMGGERAATGFLTARDARLRQELADGLGADERSALARINAATGPALWSLADAPVVASLARLAVTVEDADRTGGAVCAVGADGMLSALLYADDKKALLSRVAGYIASMGGSVFSAVAVPFAVGDPDQPRRRAIVVIEANRAGAPPRPFASSSPEVLQIEHGLSRIAQGDDAPIGAPRQFILDRRQAFEVEPEVTIHPGTASDALVVEVEARDRPGLLFLLAGALAEIGVDIVFASVATFGHRAVDTFYLRDSPGYKIEDARRIEAVRRGLLRVLSEV